MLLNCIYAVVVIIHSFTFEQGPENEISKLNSYILNALENRLNFGFFFKDETWKIIAEVKKG